MTHRDEPPRRHDIHEPLQTPEALAREPLPFPVTTREAPLETPFGDWERRLTRNLARRSDGRWEPLTWTHGVEPSPTPAVD